MWPDLIVLAHPLIDDDPGLVDACEPFSVEDLPAQGTVEALVVAILPGGSLDRYGLA